MCAYFILKHNHAKLPGFYIYMFMYGVYGFFYFGIFIIQIV